MGSESQARLDSLFRYDSFNFHEKAERDFKAQLKQKRLEYLERHHQAYQELAEELDRRVNDACINTNQEWNHRLKELRKNVLNLEKQNTMLKKINAWHTERMSELDLLDFHDFIKTVPTPEQIVSNRSSMI